jgi:hypothetical protein
MYQHVLQYVRLSERMCVSCVCVSFRPHPHLERCPVCVFPRVCLYNICVSFRPQPHLERYPVWVCPRICVYHECVCFRPNPHLEMSYERLLCVRVSRACAQLSQSEHNVYWRVLQCNLMLLYLSPISAYTIMCKSTYQCIPVHADTWRYMAVHTFMNSRFFRDI